MLVGKSESDECGTSRDGDRGGDASASLLRREGSRGKGAFAAAVGDVVTNTAMTFTTRAVDAGMARKKMVKMFMLMFKFVLPRLEQCMQYNMVAGFEVMSEASTGSNDRSRARFDFQDVIIDTQDLGVSTLSVFDVLQPLTYATLSKIDSPYIVPT